MRFTLRIRVVIFIVVFALALIAVLAGGSKAWQKRNYWEAQLEKLVLDNIALADEIRERISYLNSRLLLYGLSRQPEARDDFEMATNAVWTWLAEDEDAKRYLPESLRILSEVKIEYTNYLAHAEQFLREVDRAESISPTNPLLDTIEHDWKNLVRLTNGIPGIQEEALQSLLIRARRDINMFETFLYIAWSMMIVSLFMLAWVVYRDLIAPLRRTVIRSRAIIERQEKLAALGLVAAGIAHEIRNPLNTINARLEIQRRLLDEQSPAVQQSLFIEEEIDRLEGIVQGVLNFASPSHPLLQKLRLNSVLESLEEWVRPYLEKSDIQFQTDYVGDPEISVDPNQLKQALINLIKNAAESVGRQGAVTLRTRPSKLVGREIHQAVAIEVQDTGPGIPPNARKRLFDPFFTTKENGTGLGLSITTRIVDAHGGQLECDSAPGCGAVFRILLPCQ